MQPVSTKQMMSTYSLDSASLRAKNLRTHFFCEKDNFLVIMFVGTVNRIIGSIAPCGLRGCKNGPAPFPGRMLYKATKPGLVCLSYLRMLYHCIVVYSGPFLCTGIVSFRCCVFYLLVVLAKLSLIG